MQNQEREKLISRIAEEVLDNNYESFRHMAFSLGDFFTCHVGAPNNRIYLEVDVYNDGEEFFTIEIQNIHRDRDHSYPNISKVVGQKIGKAYDYLAKIRRDCLDSRYDF